jgi:hypothetical protein
MSHKMFFIYSIILILAIILSGCASPATAIPTVEALSCPTSAPQSCPTQALQAPEMNEWRWGNSKLVEFVITFDPGDKCSIQSIDPYDGSGLAYEIVVNDQTYQNYMVAAMSLEKGKTLKDLQAWHAGGANNTNPPPWSKLEAMDVVSPMSRTIHATTVDIVPLYFVCFIQGPDDQRVIGELEGVPIPGQ